MKKIYIGDDDQDILVLLDIFLKNEGYQVQTFDTGDDLYAAFHQDEADLIILDIMMPGSSGLSICQKIRKISSVPIILLTAKDSDADYIAGISLGGDDYLIKPFNPTVLSMKVKSLLRRVDMTRGGDPDLLIQSDLKYSKKDHAIYVGAEEVPLSKTEFACLKFMMDHFGEAISRERLLTEVWGYDSLVETRVTDETIRKIRKKLSQLKSKSKIRNKWGYGYILEENTDYE